MPQVRFEPTIPVFKRAKTVDALDRAATVIGLLHVRLQKLHESQIHIKGHSTTIIFHQHMPNITINKTGY
jgi:hypothetical protein